MKLSIIVPVYNMASDGKLEYCLRSLMAQTISDYEVIAVDDASTDASREVLNAMQAEFPDVIRFSFSPVNLRQGGAKNIGLRMAKGEWIGFVDSDDWVTPDMYEKLLQKAEDTDADVVGCDYSICYEHSMNIGKIVEVNCADQTGILQDEQYRKLVLAPGSMVIKIYKREIIFSKNLFFPEHVFYEDNCMSPLWMLQAKHFERVPEPMYFYYQHNASTVHHISLSKCEDRMTTMDLLIDTAKKLGYYDTYREEFEYKYAELYFKNTLFSYMSAGGMGKLRFAYRLRKGINDRFPGFQKNRYYQDKTHPEERKLLAYCMQSPLYFFLYYKALWSYRKLKKRLRK